MNLFLISLGWVLSGAILLPFIRAPQAANRLGALWNALGAALALAGAVRQFGAAPFDRVVAELPLGAVHLHMDNVSAFFAAVISLVSLLASVYGTGYLRHYEGRRNLGACWSFYGLLVLGMLLVTVAWDGIFFLISWELMSVSSLFLVLFDGHLKNVRRAGWVYMAATHLGTACLLVLFLLLGQGGRFDFNHLNPAAPATLVFALGLVGFGVKAGLVPLHVWLPEAHPAAPSHVSALMSGVMIKTGIYGIVRLLLFYHESLPAQWGWTLCIVGAATGILGVLFALAQHDLKALLAYHSVENIGIIAIGLGLGCLGLAYGLPPVAAAGFAGAFMHVLNHALFKSLLFFGAGAVYHATGSRNLEQMGGLMKRMPATGRTFLLAAAAICGLPPLNGFISEFLIYSGAFQGVVGNHPAGLFVCGALAVVALALIGGLAVACFAKAVGVVFLGEPRSEKAAHAEEVPAIMRVPMWAGAALCGLLGLAGPVWVGAVWARMQPAVVDGIHADGLSGPLAIITMVCAAFYLLLAVVGAARVLLRRRGTVAAAETWGCGFTAATARMQYSASSFADSATGLFEHVLQTEVRHEPVQGLFPAAGHRHTHTADIFERFIYAPFFRFSTWFALHMRRFQNGSNQLYLLYVLITLFVLLFVLLGRGGH